MTEMTVKTGMQRVIIGIGMVCMLLLLCPQGASETIYVDDDNAFDPFMDGSEAHPYDTIQKAVYDAADGDTIIVRPGTYTPDAGHTEVLVNVRVFLEGAGPVRTTIDGEGLGNALHLSADGIEVSGFTVTGASEVASGVRISGEGCLIEDCIVTGNAVGIALDGNGNTVRNCTVELNGLTGVRVRLLASNNTISSSHVLNNTEQGIQASGGNRIEDTVLSGSNHTVVLLGDLNEVFRCAFYNASRGVLVRGNENLIDQCTFRNCSVGVSIDEDDLTDSNGNTVIDCEFRDGETGVILDDDDNVIESCALGGWWTGVRISGDGNSVMNCTAPEGMWGTAIEVEGGAMTTVLGCEFHNSGYANVWAMFAEDLEFTGCLFNGSYMGINLYQCNRTSVRGCEFIGAWQGMTISWSADPEVRNCTFDVRETGLQMEGVTGAAIDRCAFTGGGIGFWGWEAEHFDSHDIADCTLEGLPIVYVAKASGGTVDGDVGMVIVASSTGVNVDGITMSDGGFILIAYSESVNVTDTSVSDARMGLYLFRSSGCTIVDSEFSDISETGIYLASSSECVVARCVVERSASGITVEGPRNVIRSCRIEANIWAGIAIWGNRTVLKDCEVSDNDAGILISYSRACTVSGCTLAGNYMFLDGGSRRQYDSHTIEGNTVDGDPVVYVVNATEGDIDPAAAEVFVVGCEGLEVSGLDMGSGGPGLLVAYCEDITVSDCSFDKQQTGLTMVGCTGCLVSDVVITDCNWTGILAISTNDTMLSGCTVTGGSSGGVFYDSHGDTIVDCEFSGQMWEGISLGSCDGFTIEGCSATDGMMGISLQWNVSATTIRYTRVEDNRRGGIQMFEGSDIVVRNCSVQRNGGNGIDIVYSSGVLVTRNVIADNDAYGVSLGWGTNTTSVHHNNFLDNGNGSAPQGFEDWGTSDNGWDDGEEGNHWSDYTGSDSDDDGIGDDPYVINDNGSADDYPLMDEIDIVVDRNTPPEVSIDSPADGALVSGTVTVTAAASDAEGGIVVEMSVDGGAWTGMDDKGDGTWTGDIDTLDLDDGERTVSVRATDAEGLEAIDEIDIVVDNTSPEIDIVSPSGTVSGDVTFEVDVEDEHLDGVRCRVDGGSWTTMEEGSSWTLDWDSTQVADGQHTLDVEATDGAGNSALESADFTVENEEPADLWVEIDTPTDEAVVSGSVVISGTAGDSGVVDDVRLFIDGTEAAVSGIGTWSHTWNTLTASNGVHEIVARAVEGSNFTDAAINVTVYNEPGENAPPEVVIDDHDARVDQGATATFYVTVTDPDGPGDLTAVEVRVLDDGDNVVMTEDDVDIDIDGSEYAVSLDTSGMEGTYTFLIRARDSANATDEDEALFEVVVPDDGDGGGGEEDDGGILDSGAALGGVAVVAAVAALLVLRRRKGRGKAADTVETVEVASMDIVDDVDHGGPGQSASSFAVADVIVAEQ